MCQNHYRGKEDECRLIDSGTDRIDGCQGNLLVLEKLHAKHRISSPFFDSHKYRYEHRSNDKCCYHTPRDQTCGHV